MVRLPRRIGDHGQDPEDEHRDRGDLDGPEDDLEGDEPAGVERGIGDHAHQTRDGRFRLRRDRVDFRAVSALARIEHLFYDLRPPPGDPFVAGYAELHCHSHFSFLDGASAPDDLVARAVELGMPSLGITDHQGLYGAVRFSTAAEAAGLHPVLGLEIELLDAGVPDPGGIVVPASRPWRPGRRPPVREEPRLVTDGRPQRPRPERARLPGHRRVVKEDHRGVGEPQRGPHLLLLARDAAGWRSLCRLVSRANLAGTKAVPAFTHELLEANHEGVVALSGCRDGELARRLRAGDREGARALAERYAALFGTGESAATSGFVLELAHHLLPDDDWLASETARLADELGLPVVVTNDVHYAHPEGRELQDVLAAIRHGRSLGELADLRRPDGESYLKGEAELLALPPADPSTAEADPVLARRWREGIAASVEIAAACHVDLAFERYRFPGFPVPKGETAFSYLSTLCWDGARRRYHPLTSAVVNRLAHELDVIERVGLAEFFLICWDLMRFAKEQGIPAQGRGSATSSIVSYTLGISRVEPIGHNLLFERFINEGRTTYPDVDIDFSSERREEVIQYVYERYGEEHTGMVCNLVTYRARSAVREVGYALGFPRPLVDRVAKALETYDSVMVRRDLEAEGGFAEFFKRPSELGPVVPTEARGLTDDMGQLNHARGGKARAAHGSSDGGRDDDGAALGEGLIDGMGQLNTRMPLVGKVPPWRQPPTPEDPNAPRPFAWLRDTPLGAEAGADLGRTDRVARLAPGDDEGGPGDSPVSVRWIQEGAPTREQERWRDWRAARTGPVVEVDPESGLPVPAPRRVDLPIGGPSVLDRPIDRRAGAQDEGGPGDETAAARRWAQEQIAARARAAQQRGAARARGRDRWRAASGQRGAPVGLGTVAGAVRPDRRLPAPPLDPFGRDARDRGTAHRRRADRARDDARPGRRPVRQARRRDDEADQARPAGPRDARRDRRDAPARRA